MDVIKRYDHAGDYPFEKIKDKIAEILKIVIRNGKGIEVNTADMCACIRKTVTDILIEKVDLALKQTKMKKLVLAGGVSDTVKH